jgi:hypothetical protein
MTENTSDVGSPRSTRVAEGPPAPPFLACPKSKQTKRPAQPLPPALAGKFRHSKRGRLNVLAKYLPLWMSKVRAQKKALSFEELKQRLVQKISRRLKPRRIRARLRFLKNVLTEQIPAHEVAASSRGSRLRIIAFVHAAGFLEVLN